jgi:hypothetical protein
MTATDRIYHAFFKSETKRKTPQVKTMIMMERKYQEILDKVLIAKTMNSTVICDVLLCILVTFH